MRCLIPVMIGWAGMLCGQADLHAAIVYRDFADIVLNSQDGPDDFRLDVDLNGVNDLWFVASSDCPSGCGIGIGMLNGSTIGQSIPHEFGARYAERFEAGVLVNASADYVANGTSLVRGSLGFLWDGPWTQSTDVAYIPFTLLVNGNTHFGWIRAHGATGSSWYPNSRIFDIAYEDAPFIPIIAGAVPAPGATALALAGLVSIAVRRRRVDRD